jgi:hypothetical protein
VINHVSEDIDSLLFRVNVYDYQKGIPGEKILKENVFIKSIREKGVHSVDLSLFNLILEHDVLLT